MHALMEQHLVWMQMQNFSDDTVTTRRACIGYFLDWCRERALDNPAEITRPILERYQRSLYQYRKKNGEPLTFRTQNSRLRAIKGWFRWLARQNYLVGDSTTIADIALYAYTHVAHEGGFSLDAYPGVRRWLERIAAHPKHRTMEAGA